jgi:hypothetical protein
MKTYLSEDAAIIFSCLPSEASPPDGSEALFLLYAVLMRAKGENVTASEVHDAWAAWMQMNGSAHAALKPFEELSLRAQEEDTPYVVAIQRAARVKRSREM